MGNCFMVKFYICDGVLDGVEYLGNETVLNIPSDVKIIKKAKIDQNIKEIIIPSSVEKIEVGAFLHGEKINKITILDNTSFILQNKLLLDRKQTVVYFSERDIAGSVMIPSTVKVINDYAFYNCKKITSIKISDNVEYIGAFAFTSCTRLSNIQLPKVNSLKLKESTFENCCSLKNIAISHNVTGFGPSLFYDCQNLERVEIESDKILNIPYKCFMHCEKLIRLDFKDGIKQIEDKAFLGCSNIVEISLPNTIIDLIGDQIFERDLNLTVFTSSLVLKDYCNNHDIPCLNNIELLSK